MAERLNLVKECVLTRLGKDGGLGSFSCGDDDLDGFFHSEAALYAQQLLGKAYVFSTRTVPSEIVAVFTIANDSIKSALIPNVSRNKIQRKIPNSKRTRSYPAALIGRLGVSVSYRGRDVGSQVLDYLKYLFTREDNITGCRFLVVDAYNNTDVIGFYAKNGFKPLYPTEDLEREAFHVGTDERLNSRLLYFDLMQYAVLQQDVVSPQP